MKHLLLLCLMVCSLSCNKEKRMMRDFDEITEVTLDGIQHTDKNDWQCDNEVPDKINDLWTRGEALEALVSSSQSIYIAYNHGMLQYVKDMQPGLNPVPSESIFAYILADVGTCPDVLIEYIIVDQDLNVIDKRITILEDNQYPNTKSFAYLDRVNGYPQTRVYYRIFTKQNGDVCIGHGDIRWE